MKKVVTLITAFAIIITSLFALGGQAFAAVETADRKIRVGVTNLSNFSEKNEDGTFSGYFIDYLNKIAQYTGWEYEFVEGQWAECQQWLKHGKVDFIGGITKEDSETLGLNISKWSIGTLYHTLVTSTGNDNYAYEDYASFNGATIGVVSGLGQSMVSDLRNHAAEVGFKFNLKLYNDIEEMNAALESGEVDMGVVNSLRNLDGYRVVDKYNVSEFYVAGSGADTKYMDILDEAHEQLKLSGLYFDTNLFQQYYTTITQTVTEYTKDEKDYIKNRGVIKIGAVGGADPLAYSTGESFGGIIADVLDLVCQQCGLDFEYVLIPSDADPYQYCRQQGIDIYAGVFINSERAVQNGDSDSYAYSEPLFTTAADLVVKDGSEIDFTQECTVAISKVNVGTSAYDVQKYDNIKLLVTNTSEEALAAVDNGEADAALDNIFVVERYIRSHPNCGLDVVSAYNEDQYMRLCIMDKSDSLLVSIINKAIALADDEKISAILVRESMGGAQLNLWDYIERNPVQFVIIAVAVLSAVILLLGLVLYSRMKQNQALKRVNRLTRFDEMTGLYNKETFYIETERVMKHEGKEKFAVIRMDIDRFRVYNKVFGMSEGDALIKKLGDELMRWLGECDSDNRGLCAHFDADHFSFCIRKEKLNIDKMVDRFTNMLERQTKGFEILPSFGIYYVEKSDEISVSEMCDRAMLALQSSKANYLVRYGEYNEAIIEKITEEQTIVSEMNAALQGNQFKMMLQPQYDHSNGKVVGAEALVRWKHPQRGMISPGVFIPIFEKNGFITKLDEYIWESACKRLRKWLDYGVSVVPISVNISRVDVYNTNLCEVFDELTEKYDVPKNLLKLEITESAYMDNPKQLIDVVTKLRNQGFVVEMDDFGSGYSSLNTLKEVPVDLIKLDLKFLMGDDPFKRSGCILISIISMAHWLGLQVIAEGVETEQQADYLLSIGCKYIQGRYYGGAMSVDEFDKLLEENKTDGCRRSGVAVAEESGDFWSYDNINNLLFNKFMDGSMVIDQRRDSLESLRVNGRFSQETGISDVDLDEYRNDIIQLIHYEDRGLFLSALEKSVTSEESVCVCRWHKGRGEFALIQCEIRLLSVQTGRRILLCKVRNISEETKLKLALEEKNNLLDAVVSHIPATVLLLKPVENGNYKVIYGNVEESRLHNITDGFLHRELYGVDPRDKEKFLAAIDGDKPFSFEYRSKHLEDNCWHLKKCEGQRITIDAEPKPVVLLIITEQFSESRANEDADCMVKLIRSLLRKTSSGVIVAASDANGICVDHINSAAYELLGLEKGEDENSIAPIRDICEKAGRMLAKENSVQYTAKTVGGNELVCNAAALSWGEDKQVFCIILN